MSILSCAITKGKRGHSLTALASIQRVSPFEILRFKGFVEIFRRVNTYNIVEIGKVHAKEPVEITVGVLPCPPIPIASL
jgi:hypothetical protein